jgi:hypothetical protein
MALFEYKNKKQRSLEITWLAWVHIRHLLLLRRCDQNVLLLGGREEDDDELGCALVSGVFPDMADLEFVLRLHAGVDGAYDDVDDGLQDGAVLVGDGLDDAIDAGDDGGAPKDEWVAWRIPFVEPRLDHEPISGYRELHAAADLQRQTPRVARLHAGAAADHPGTAHVRLIGDFQQLLSVRICNAARTKEVFKKILRRATQCRA